MEKEEEKKISDPAEKVKKEIEEKINMSDLEELINSNIIEFEFNKEKYRVRKTTYKEKSEAYNIKMKKFTELLSGDDYKLEDDLKKLYKAKGIDIDEITHMISSKQLKKQNFLIRLGNILKNSPDKKNDIEKLREEIKRINYEQQELSVKKSNLLAPSIESQSLLYTYQWLTFTVLEKEIVEGEEKKWVRAFKTFDDFLKGESDLITEASFKASLIIGEI